VGIIFQVARHRIMNGHKALGCENRARLFALLWRSYLLDKPLCLGVLVVAPNPYRL